MAKADRLARADLLRIDLEAEYAAALTDALRATAAGRWGLFGHNDDRHAQAAAAPVLDRLEEIGEAIDKLRDQLGMPPFDLQRQFMASRGPVGPQAPGEPKQAQAWLDRLATATL